MNNAFYTIAGYCCSHRESGTSRETETSCIVLGPRRKHALGGPAPVKRVRTYPEADAQKRCVAWLRARGDCKVIRCENGEQRTPQATQRAIAMGMDPGDTDLIVVGWGRVLFLEMKSSVGTVSPKQREIHRILRMAGHDVYVAFGFGDKERIEIGAILDGYSRNRSGVSGSEVGADFALVVGDNRKS